MIKAKVRILTDVDMTVDVDINNYREVKRKVLERLAKDGYVNSEITFIHTEKIDRIDELTFDLDDEISTFMYGKV